MAQVYEYARGLNVSASFLVVVGFSSNDSNIMDAVNTQISSFQKMHNDFYIQAIYIDASKKQSASKTTLKDIK